MSNPVLNFSFLFEPDSTLKLDTDWRVAIVPEMLTAEAAAELAEANGYDVLIVQAPGGTRGLFFKDYLRDLLPGHDKAGPILQDAPSVPQSLADMIREIDLGIADFHSELVNYYPTLRKCPKGHVTSGNPCARHSLKTTKY